MAWRRGTKVRVAVYGTIVIVPVLVAIALTAMPHTCFGCRFSKRTAAVAALGSYLSAQGTFQRSDRYGKGKRVYANPIDGKGFPDLWRIGGPLDAPDGNELKLIEFALARATSPGSAKLGYWFIGILADKKAGPYDYATDCGLCAVPAVYGKTGTETCIISARDTVYMKDNGGVPVTVWPDVENEGWRPVER